MLIFQSKLQISTAAGMAGLTYEDFRVLRMKFRADSEHGHQVFFKAHSVRVEEPSKPRDRTLFCANLPPWASVEAITRLFQRNGPVEAVHMQHEPSVTPPPPPPCPQTIFRDLSSPYNLCSGFRFAYIVFSTPQGLRNCLTKMDLSQPFIVSTPEHPVITGVKLWAQQYNSQFVPEEKVMQEVDSYMAEYDSKVAKEKLEQERLAQPDEDGWVTVTRPEKRPVKAKLEDKEEKKGRGKKNRRKKKKVELKNFYSHQIKEDKMSNIRALREKFEEDKQKIAKMKQERKFRPF